MSGGAAPVQTQLSPAAILARELSVDRPTAAIVVAATPVVDRPAGVQLLAAATVADIRRITGAAAFPMANASLATFLLAR